MIEWKFTAAFSRNIINDFTEYSFNYDSGLDRTEEISIDHEDVNIAYSPSMIASSEYLVFTP